MQLVSSAFNNNSKIPYIYTCDGKNISFELSFIDVPTNTSSLSLIMHYPDAPSGDLLH